MKGWHTKRGKVQRGTFSILNGSISNEGSRSTISCNVARCSFSILNGSISNEGDQLFVCCLCHRDFQYPQRIDQQ